MKLNNLIVSAVSEGDCDAEDLAAELIGGISLRDITDEQIAVIADIRNRYAHFLTNMPTSSQRRTCVESSETDRSC